MDDLAWIEWGSLLSAALTVAVPLLLMVGVAWVVVTHLRLRAEVRTLREELRREREENGLYVVPGVEDEGEGLPAQVKRFDPVA